MKLNPPVSGRAVEVAPSKKHQQLGSTPSAMSCATFVAIARVLKGMDCNSALFVPIGAMAQPMMASAMTPVCASPAFSERF